VIEKNLLIELSNETINRGHMIMGCKNNPIIKLRSFI